MIRSSPRRAIFVFLLAGPVVVVAVAAALAGLALPPVLVATVAWIGVVFGVTAGASEYRAARNDGMTRGPACRRALRDVMRALVGR